IQTARKVESKVEFWEVEPHQELLGNRDPDEAYLAGTPGEKYILYFTDGGEVTLDLRDWDQHFEVSWVSIATGVIDETADLVGSQWTPIRSPDQGGWVAAITKNNALFPEETAK
ncbi:MAG: hypothetical protein KC931_21790, partial [Candidatus Omnitrophica bacterium]|nr:hypothetical protein [Candidatus Omnitrophota bacterium]